MSLMHLSLADDEVNEAEVQQVQQLIDLLHAYVHSSDIQVRQREWAARTGTDAVPVCTGVVVEDTVYWFCSYVVICFM